MNLRLWLLIAHRYLSPLAEPVRLAGILCMQLGQPVFMKLICTKQVWLYTMVCNGPTEDTKISYMIPATLRSGINGRSTNKRAGLELWTTFVLTDVK